MWRQAEFLCVYLERGHPCPHRAWRDIDSAKASFAGKDSRAPYTGE